MEQIKGYKVFNSDWSCSPVNGEYFKQYACPGVFMENIKPKIQEKGMHFCKKLINCFDYYDFNPCNKVAEVIALGDIDVKGDKFCTNKLLIVRELSWREVLDTVNTGIENTGKGNTGSCNNGNWNTGNYNKGDWNRGDWNKTDYTYGCFNTQSHGHKIFKMFNKTSIWTIDDWKQSNAYQILDSIKQFHLKLVKTNNYQQWWNELQESDKKEIISLPNFDSYIFY